MLNDRDVVSPAVKPADRVLHFLELIEPDRAARDPAKRDLIVQEHGAATLAVMRQIKAALDLRGILNPGKMVLD